MISLKKCIPRSDPQAQKCLNPFIYGTGHMSEDRSTGLHRYIVSPVPGLCVALWQPLLLPAQVEQGCQEHTCSHLCYNGYDATAAQTVETEAAQWIIRLQKRRGGGFMLKIWLDDSGNTVNDCYCQSKTDTVEAVWGCFSALYHLWPVYCSREVQWDFTFKAIIWLVY